MHACGGTQTATRERASGPQYEKPGLKPGVIGAVYESMLMTLFFMRRGNFE